MSDFDVLIVGGYSLNEIWSGGGSKTRDRIRMHYNNHLVTFNFIRHLVQTKGNLERSETLFLRDNKAKLVNRSLNTIYLYDYLVKRNISTQATNYFYHEKERFFNLIKLQPKVVAISTSFISNISEINEIAKNVKDNSPNTIVIAGGIKVLKSFKKYNLYKEDYFEGLDTDNLINNNFFFKKQNDELIDIFIIEEHGEETLVQLINKIKSGEEYKSLPNLAYYKNETILFTKRLRESFDFEKDYISWDKIPSDIVGQEIPVTAGIGCPFRCAFCDFTGLHKVKIRSISNLIDELKLIQDTYSKRPIFFTDDNLFTTTKRTTDLVKAIIDNKLDFKWRGMFRVDAISDENAELIAKSGCVTAFLGVESGDDQILKNMQKVQTREGTLRAVNLLHKYGVNTLSTILVGFPGETRTSVDNTIDLLNSYPDSPQIIHQYYPFSLMIFPLCAVASPENREKYKIKGGYDTWSHLTMTSDEAKEELVRMFHQVNVPVLPYLEYRDPEIPENKLKLIIKARENLVKQGINVLNTNNVNPVYNVFNKIINSND